MGGNYAKDIYKQLMEVMERCDSLEENLKSVKSSSKTQIRSLNSEIKYLDSKCNKLGEENAALRQEVEDLTSGKKSGGQKGHPGTMLSRKSDI